MPSFAIACLAVARATARQRREGGRYSIVKNRVRSPQPYISTSNRLFCYGKDRLCRISEAEVELRGIMSRSVTPNARRGSGTNVARAAPSCPLTSRNGSPNATTGFTICAVHRDDLHPETAVPGVAPRHPDDPPVRSARVRHPLVSARWHHSSGRSVCSDLCPRLRFGSSRGALPPNPPQSQPPPRRQPDR
jgi:hypothetical protein